MIIASGVNFGPGMALMFLVFPTAIIAGIVGWLGLRPTPPKRWAIVIAFAILLSPVALAMMSDPADGFLLAMDVMAFTWITPVVGIGLAGATVSKYGSMQYNVDRYAASPSTHRLAGPEIRAGRDELLNRIKLAGSAPSDQAFDRQLQLAEYQVALGDIDGAARTFRESVPLAIAALQAADIHRILKILVVVIAFGTRAERQLVAEEWQRRGMRETDTTTALLEGLTKFVLGRDQDARAPLAQVCQREWRLILAATAAGVIALIDRDAELFTRHLRGSLAEHHNRYRKQPADAAGAVNVLALALARLAVESGMSVTEQPYLPLALLPNE